MRLLKDCFFENMTMINEIIYVLFFTQSNDEKAKIECNQPDQSPKIWYN